MWIIAFFGMATIYAEAVLAQETRVVEPDGTVLGGPVYYIKRAFPNGFGKFLAGFFAVAIILALGFMGSMVQSNSIGEACQNAFHIPSWVMGLIVSAIAAFIFIGGVQRIASVTEKIVPIMACLYLLGGLIVLIARIRYVPERLRHDLQSTHSRRSPSSAAASATRSRRPSARAPSAACSRMSRHGLHAACARAGQCQSARTSRARSR